MNSSLKQNQNLGHPPITISSWLTKSKKVKNDTLDAMDLLNFSDKIGKILSPLGVSIGTGFHEMMKILYRRSIYEIGQISKDKTKSYTEYVPEVNNVLNKIFKEVFLDFLVRENINLVENKELLFVISTRIKSYVKNRL